MLLREVDSYLRRGSAEFLHAVCSRCKEGVLDEEKPDQGGLMRLNAVLAGEVTKSGSRGRTGGRRRVRKS